MNTFFFLLMTFSALAFDWQGHRGARGLYPENTTAGMQEALKYPISTLELDVVVSQDNQVVVSHEPWMSAEICQSEGKDIKDKEHNLYRMTYEEIQKFDCGSKKHPRFPDQQKAVEGKPRLKDLLITSEALIKNLKRNIAYNIEIKSTPEDEKAGYQPSVENFSEVVVKAILGVIPASRFTIQSFDWRVLKYLHRKYPEIKLVALLEGPIKPEAILRELGFKPHVFSPYFKELQPAHVTFFHQRKILVIPWTVNTVPEMKMVKALGVDGIITDYPNLIPQVMAKTCEKDHHQFEGECVKVPKHAMAADHSPGWECEKGYVQKHLSCVEIAIPQNAELNDDGKSWKCKAGFMRYRGSCKK